MTSTEEAVDTTAMTQLAEAAQEAQRQQPSVGTLLDPTDALWGGEETDGRHSLVFNNEVPGILDVAAGRFIPEFPEQIGELLIARMQQEKAGVAIPGGEGDRVVDWATLEFLDEDNGILNASAVSVADPENGDAVYLLQLAFDNELEATVTEEQLISGGAFAEAIAEELAVAESDVDTPAEAVAAVAEPEPATEPAGVTGEYLGGHYGSTPFAFDGQNFVLDWQTYQVDQTTPEGLVGFTATALASDGNSYDTYAWFDPATGISVARAEPVTSAAAAAPAITADYLGGYYGSTPFAFDGQNFVLEWPTYQADQTTSEGLVGFTATALASDGRTYDTYAWFDPTTGISVVRAEPATGADAGAAPGAAAVEEAAQDEEFDPARHFETVLADELRDRWKMNGERLDEVGGQSYDVKGLVEGESGCVLEYREFDGEQYFADLGAHTTADDRQPVTCRLRIRDAETVWVESEETRF